MSGEWLLTPTSAFFTMWRALPNKESHQILEKIKLLEQDPTPDGKAKKQLKYLNREVFRLRCGDYRIFYTYRDPNVSLLKLDRRDDDTYEDDVDAVYLGGFDPQMELHFEEKQPNWFAPAEAEKKVLAEPITLELLENLRVPEDYHTRLLAIQTEDELLDCDAIPSEHMLQILDYMFPPTLAQVLQHPTYYVNDLDDLMRYKEGELLGFLLRLSPEQERFVSWAIRATGPTQVKGGPGTGKSTVALYRVRSLIEKLQKMGQPTPSILFTTYTNALKKFSEQLLEQLLSDDVRYVKVKTVDKITHDVLENAGQPPRIVTEEKLHELLQRAIRRVKFEGNSQQQQTQKQAIERLTNEYLLQEIGQVIVARQITSLEGYMTAKRPGRKLPLNGIQRRAVWSVHKMLLRLLQLSRVETWHMARSRAESSFSRNAHNELYDAVVIDEAQDLDPSILRLLIGLCRTPNRLFITADANQSIYGSGFNWRDVHDCLKFQGRTSVLRANFRSTRQIGEAAQSYLAAGALEPEAVERIYVNTGTRPLVRFVDSDAEEAQLLASFLRGASRELKLQPGASAILCPSERACEAIASALVKQDVKARFMKGRELDLTSPEVKVLTLNSSKGLEFPVVALAGFIHSRFAMVPEGELDEEQQETAARDRRLMFVGMTRAMRALLVVVPVGTESPLLTGFDRMLWDVVG
jgi:superfamily I DNA/RNA helicase/mRNA-degrading endonuclease RelE of RelBE toxin-antitoxin system